MKNYNNYFVELVLKQEQEECENENITWEHVCIIEIILK